VTPDAFVAAMADERAKLLVDRPVGERTFPKVPRGLFDAGAWPETRAERMEMGHCDETPARVAEYLAGALEAGCAVEMANTALPAGVHGWLFITIIRRKS